MLFCGPNFRKAALFAAVNTAGPHGVHAAELVLFHVFAAALRAYAGHLHGWIDSQGDLPPLSGPAKH